MTGEIGVCTFNWSCINVAHGVRIGSCLDRIFVGTCCKIPNENSRTTTSKFSGSSSQPHSEYTSSNKFSTEYISSKRSDAEYILSGKPTTEYLDSTRKPSFFEEFSSSSRKSSDEYSNFSKKPSGGEKEQQEAINQNTQVEPCISNYNIFTNSPEGQKNEKPVSIIDLNHSNVTINSSTHHTQKSNHNLGSLPSSQITVNSYNTKHSDVKSAHTTFPPHNRKPILPIEMFRKNPTTSFSQDTKSSSLKQNTYGEDDLFFSILESFKLKATTKIPPKPGTIPEVVYQRRPVASNMTHSEQKPAAVELSQVRKPVTEDTLNKNETLIALESHILGTPVISDEFYDKRKPISSEQSHDLRKPIVPEVSHDLRRPILPNTSHDLRKPELPDVSHHLRKPVSFGASHDLRKPSVPEVSHDQRWPVLNEETHDRRLPVLNLFAWPYSFFMTDNEKLIQPDTSNLSLNISQDPDIKVNTNEIPSTDPSHIFDDSESGLQDESVNSIYTSITADSSTIKNVSDLFSNTMDKDYTTPNFTLFTEPSYQKPPSKSPSESFQNEQSKGSPTSVKDISRVCGRARSSTIVGRIVGGRKSHYLRWPWMISLRRYEGQAFKHKCGAALLNELWAITAAHCVDGKLPNDVMLRLGEYNLYRTDESYPHVERRIYMIVIHPNFDPVTYENDLALLRFYEPVQFRANIVPVCLPISVGNIAGRTAVVTGWGRLSEEGELPGSLHEVHMPILTNKECEDMYSAAGYSETIRDVFVCAGVLSGGLDACEGDSGGPMVIRGEKGHWTLVGLISWGMGCAAPKQPGVYTRITKFTDWINEIIAY
ncbi:serine protease filzig-like isoform X2 [Stegodyphus dumicola]|nr:serine protease filzig-like isoform X2 [Stegodyphus dumicola]XP_035205876.1 serine protease filzig-like isoform X2 [Stegodyphus dumicola]